MVGGMGGGKGNVAGVVTVHGVPIRAVDVATVAGGSDTDGRIVLLRAIDAVWEIVVGGPVIKLRGRLIPLRGPIFATVDGGSGAAVVAVADSIGFVGVGPQAVVIAVRSIEA